MAGDDFYVRFRDGKMRHVDYVGDFDDEAEWCAQCGVPVDIDGGEYYCCDADGCLKWLEGTPVEYARGVWVSNMFWNV